MGKDTLKDSGWLAKFVRDLKHGPASWATTRVEEPVRQSTLVGYKSISVFTKEYDEEAFFRCTSKQYVGGDLIKMVYDRHDFYLVTSGPVTGFIIASDKGNNGEYTLHTDENRVVITVTREDFDRIKINPIKYFRELNIFAIDDYVIFILRRFAKKMYLNFYLGIKNLLH